MISTIFARSGGPPAAALITRLTEIERTYSGWCDYAKRLSVLAPVVPEAVNSSARNAQCLSWPHVDLFSVNSPTQNSVDTVDRFFVVIVAMRRSRQALRARDNELKGSYAATRVFSRDQEAYLERAETDGLGGRIDVEIDGQPCHVGSSLAVNSVYLYNSKRNLLHLSMPSSQKSAPVKTEHLLIGALLRVPAQAIHRRIIKELNAAGFEELRLPHIAVLQFPGPDGVRPGTLAERAGITKQAMNQLLRSLEGLGYIVRSDVPDEGRGRVVRFTKRGHAAYARVYAILHEIEREWSDELGSKDFARLKELLTRIWESPLTS
jgi:DNA-binding MarR family transcriptional regulator